MAVSCGLVGLPNVGKSTLFNLLMRQDVVAAENFPFCTIDPHDGQAIVPDGRLGKIATLAKAKQVVPAMLNVTDIAGLIRGASQGEGLGSAFLQNIRDVDAIVHVVRFFASEDIVHVDGSVDPMRDCVVIENELILADLSFLEKRELSLQKQRFSKDPLVVLEWEFIHSAKDFLAQGKSARLMDVSAACRECDSYKGLLSIKPVMYVCNVAIEDMQSFDDAPATKALREYASGAPIVPICILFEKELSCIQDAQERQEFLKDAGIKEEAFSRLVGAAYNLLGQISFFTAGEKEARAWTVEKGSHAQHAAGKIHSDIARGFIVADVVSCEDFCSYGGWQGARQAGRVRQEGKEYIVQDGDVMLFKFNV